jgi:hypothetical protein
MSGAMSFDQAPPIAVPLRFFLSAPLFGCLAGLLLGLLAEQVLASRWSGSALAVTHLLTLGFMLQAMCGALMQVMPVAVGANLWRPRLVALVTHTGLVVGTLLLVSGFLTESAAWFRWAVPVLALALGSFIAAVAVALLRTAARGPTVNALRFSILALGIASGLGIALASMFGWGVSLPALRLTDLHAVWGLIGWGLLLLVAVAILVVPMFQLTPPYRKAFVRAFPVAVLAGLATWSIASALDEGLGTARLVIGVLLGVLVAGFAVETLRLQQRRRRRHVDAMFLFWRTGMVALVVAVALAFGLMATGDSAYRGHLELAIGLAVLPGCFVSLINGMLYKIVPFLVWLHLQPKVRQPPNMNQIVEDKAMRGQLWLHWAALLALAGGIFYSPLLAGGGLLFAASCAWLELNLLRAARLYVRVSRDAAIPA